MSTQHKFIYKHDEACYLGERYPQQEIIIQSTCDDLDAHEILQLFKSYMMACGYAEKSFYDACTEAAENNPHRKDSSCSGNRHELGETQLGKQPQSVKEAIRRAEDNIITARTISTETPVY